MFDELASIVKRCPKGNFTSELLNECSELFQITLNNKYRHIKNGSIQLWNSTFGQNNSIKYPSSLLPVLVTLKSQLTLPSLPQDKTLPPNKEPVIPSFSNRSDEELDQGI